jgi:hypothetical protein
MHAQKVVLYAHLPPRAGEDSTFKYYLWALITKKVVGLLVWALIQRHIGGRRSRGQTRGPPPFGFVLLQCLYIIQGCSAMFSGGTIYIPMVILWPSLAWSVRFDIYCKYTCC